MTHIILITNGKIDKKDTIYYPLSELIEKMKSGGIVWDKISHPEKYGTFYKLKKKKNKLYISSLSEVFDGIENKKYITYLFGG